MGFSINLQLNCIKMKLIVLIALVGCALAIPNPFPEEEYGPANGLRIPDYNPYTPKEKYGPANGLRIPDYYPKEKYGPTNGLRIPDYPPYTPKEKYGPTNGLRIPDQYYQKGYSKGYYHPVRCVPVRRRYRCLPRRRSRCIRRRRPRCYGRRSYAKGCGIHHFIC